MWKANVVVFHLSSETVPTNLDGGFDLLAFSR